MKYIFSCWTTKITLFIIFNGKKIFETFRHYVGIDYDLNSTVHSGSCNCDYKYFHNFSKTVCCRIFASKRFNKFPQNMSSRVLSRWSLDISKASS